MPGYKFTIMIERQERTALLILLMVLVICGIFAVISEELGKGPFAQNYTVNSPEGSLVSYQGIVQKVTVTSTGGNTILDMGTVQLFIPASVETMDAVTGDTIQVYGTIQTWKGKREILVKDSKDIMILVGSQERNQRF